MTRQESKREDLLAEATALVERVEFEAAGLPDPIVIGFRRDGSGSIYVGQEIVFQFNSRHQFRRGFRNGRLMKAENGRLVALVRERTAQEVCLTRHELDDGEQEEYLAFVKAQIGYLHQQATASALRVLRQVPADGSVEQRVREWLALLVSGFEVARAPNA